MTDNLIYWLWLQDCLGPAAKVKELLADYNNAKSFYLAGESAWKSKNLSRVALGKLKRKNPESFYKNIEFCFEHKIYLLCPDDEYYPQRLLEIENYPLILYVRGDHKILNSEKTENTY